jgi:transposase
MLSIPPTTPIYFATQPADMRRSFDGLSGLVQAAMQLESASGALFVFRNRRGTQLKILYWVGDGWAIWHRRLEVGCWMHARRRFFKAGVNGDKRADDATTRIARLYRSVSVGRNNWHFHGNEASAKLAAVHPVSRCTSPFCDPCSAARV